MAISSGSAGLRAMGSCERAIAVTIGSGDDPA
jgi:hypothetical protein